MQNILLLGSCEGAGAEDIEQMIRIENVSKWYGDFQVLKNCSTSVKKGEVVVICGPSGSGKSTLIKTVNGLEDYQEGTIYVNNINIGDPHTNLPKLRAHVGMVFQHFELFPHLTIRDNLTLAQMKVLKRSRDQANKRGMELLDRVGLIKQADKFPPQLSGGQQQRVAIARALAMDPICMLFDEPTKGLDEARIRLVADTLNELDGQTMVCVTHDLSFARDVANRIGVMYAANLIEVADADELYAHPLHPYTRDMLAAMPENGLHFRPGYAPAHDDTRVTGCKYRMRCPNCSEKCAEMPPMADVDGHKVRCWQYV
mgnify:CR=1 FL=1